MVQSHRRRLDVPRHGRDGGSGPADQRGQPDRLGGRNLPARPHPRPRRRLPDAVPDAERPVDRPRPGLRRHDRTTRTSLHSRRAGPLRGPGHDSRRRGHPCCQQLSRSAPYPSTARPSTTPSSGARTWRRRVHWPRGPGTSAIRAARPTATRRSSRPRPMRDPRASRAASSPSRSTPPSRRSTSRRSRSTATSRSPRSPTLGARRARHLQPARLQRHHRLRLRLHAGRPAPRASTGPSTAGSPGP